MAIVELRRKRLTQARIAAYFGVSKSTVSRVLTRAGLSRLSDLEPAEPVRRYEYEAPGDLLHIQEAQIDLFGRRATLPQARGQSVAPAAGGKHMR